MSKKDEKKGVLVPVTQYKSFLSDPIFEEVRKTGQHWVDTVKNKTPQKPIGMDSAVFNSNMFELIIDVRGCSPENLKCTMTPNSVEVTALKLETSGGTQREASIVRNYQLHQAIRHEQGVCCLSSEGILLITVPWSK